jgi:hypothetical protein
MGTAHTIHSNQLRNSYASLKGEKLINRPIHRPYSIYKFTNTFLSSFVYFNLHVSCAEFGRV